MMKEFYFVRHGQTDHNIGKLIGDQPHIPLNETGRKQIENLRENLPQIHFEVVCESPLLRVRQTADILLGEDHPAERHVIKELEECTWKVWYHMELLNFRLSEPNCEELERFLDQTLEATQKVRSHQRPLLIVAHGGIYTALLHHFNIEWKRHVSNGELAHFIHDGEWRVESLYIPEPREPEHYPSYAEQFKADQLA